MKYFHSQRVVCKILVAAILAIIPIQSSVAQEIDPAAAKLVANGDVETAKKLLLASGIDLYDPVSVNETTNKVLQSILADTNTLQISTTIERAVTSLTRAVFELSVASELSEEATSIAVEATAQGAVTAVIQSQQ